MLGEGGYVPPAPGLLPATEISLKISEDLKEKRCRDVSRDPGVFPMDYMDSAGSASELQGKESETSVIGVEPWDIGRSRADKR